MSDKAKVQMQQHNSRAEKMRGNRNAWKTVKRDTAILVRCTSEDKARWQEAAQLTKIGKFIHLEACGFQLKVGFTPKQWADQR